ncbi:MAG: hypothetical protein KatS3mg125_0457 [Lysobacterales bacterium]|nr:MAG: hypothetical protein KatS3mg125_0457 [Xanthomonadales bacterium]
MLLRASLCALLLIPSAVAARGGPPDPYPDDQPLFVIDQNNLGQYRERLSEGHAAMLERYPSFRIPVYPSRPAFTAPDWFHQATRANVERGARLTADGNGVIDARRGLPFPDPKSALEVLWNHKLTWRGKAWRRTYMQANVTAGGAFEPIRVTETVLDRYQAEDYAGEPIIQYFLQEVTAPPRLAGTLLLVHETLNQVEQPRLAWTYNPGQRRVRRAPNVAYDNPATASDGLRTADQLYGFNGSPDRYDWHLIGKKRLIVPYNAYRLLDGRLSSRDLIRPGHLAPEHLRYEEHEVYIIEGRLKSGQRHIYAKRRLYVDAASFQVLAADHWDGLGQLWRVAEIHTVVFPEAGAMRPGVDVVYDLKNGRYAALGLMHEETRGFEAFDTLPLAAFAPDSLRRQGVR